jgi:hypothetical protein
VAQASTDADFGDKAQAAARRLHSCLTDYFLS